MKILIVDDEKDLVMTLTTILEKWGHTVVSAYDGVGAQKVLEETTVDVLISDLIMPNMDGGELLTWLNTHKKKPHFIIMSAYYNEGFIKYFSNQGITNILGKPIQFDKLQSMLKNFSLQSEPTVSTEFVHKEPVAAEPVSKNTDTRFEHMAKDIQERLPEALQIVIANPKTQTIYSTISKGNGVDEKIFIRQSGSFFLAMNALWSTLGSENGNPKEILITDDETQMVYRNIVSPEICIYVEASTQITHGLLRITVDNVVKESPILTL